MVCPTLMSVSLTPTSYFFCAQAADAASSKATDPASTARRPFMANGLMSRSSPRRFGGAEPKAQALEDEAHEAGDAGRHQVDEQQQEHAVDRPRRGLRDLVGEVG